MIVSSAAVRAPAARLSQNATPDLLPDDVLAQAREPQPGEEIGDQPDAGGTLNEQ